MNILHDIIILLTPLDDGFLLITPVKENGEPLPLPSSIMHNEFGRPYLEIPNVLSLPPLLLLLNQQLSTLGYALNPFVVWV